MTEPTTSLRDAIESAIEEPTPSGSQPIEQSAPSGTTDEGPGGSQATQTATDLPADAPAGDLNALAEGEQTDENADAQQRERDEQGRFKSKETDGIQPGPTSGPRQQADRAPASWRPDVREHWASLPEGVRSEIHRREVEVQRTLQETAEARKVAEALHRTIAPYEMFIRAENSNPIQAIDNLMSTAARLRTGTAPELAQLVAGLVNQFGVGRFGNQFIEQLDAALAGQQPQVDPQTAQVQQVLQQQLAPVQQFMSRFQQFEQQRAQQATMQAQNEVQQFLGEAEFGEDVREDMADILEVAQRRGQNMTLKQAYDRACLMNERVAQVLQQRRAAQGAAQQTGVAQRARAAAVSVSGAAPMGAMRQDPTDVRSAIEAAIAMNSR